MAPSALAGAALKALTGLMAAGSRPSGPPPLSRYPTLRIVSSVTSVMRKKPRMRPEIAMS